MMAIWITGTGSRPCGRMLVSLLILPTQFGEKAGKMRIPSDPPCLGMTAPGPQRRNTKGHYRATASIMMTASVATSTAVVCRVSALGKLSRRGCSMNLSRTTAAVRGRLALRSSVGDHVIDVRHQSRSSAVSVMETAHHPGGYTFFPSRRKNLPVAISQMRPSEPM